MLFRPAAAVVAGGAEISRGHIADFDIGRRKLVDEARGQVVLPLAVDAAVERG